MADLDRGIEQACKAYAYRTEVQAKVKAANDYEAETEAAWDAYLRRFEETGEGR